MLGNRYDNQTCSAARALELVGERWSLLIIRDALFAKVTRFGDFARRLGLAKNILADRLTGFVENGIMERVSTDGSAYEEYQLTEKGKDLAPVIIALTHWGDRWLAPNGPPIIYRHGNCGGDIEQQLLCQECDGVVDNEGLCIEIGPGMHKEHS
jgi:DNA-binding HxlR family transcriptional regulator